MDFPPHPFGFTPASRSWISAPPPDQLPLLELAADEYEDDAVEGDGPKLEQLIPSDRRPWITPKPVLIASRKVPNLPRCVAGQCQRADRAIWLE